MSFAFSSDNFMTLNTICKTLLISGLVIYLISISLSNYQYSSSHSDYFINNSSSQENIKHTDWAKSDPTNLTHLAFGLLGSERAWHHRKAYTESWWRPHTTRGFLYLDKAPTRKLLPWSKASPPYRVSDNLTKLLQETHARAPVMIRMVHGIKEVFREVDNENLRWLVMGDDDSILFVDNIVDVLSQYDHTKYYYFGGQSEFIMSNYWFSFNQGFGGAGFILSYPLAKALAEDMESCLRRHAQLSSADFITMVCIADIGVNLSPLKGIHQIDLHGDISGFLSSHPKSPLISLHHFDNVEPIFPSKNRFESTLHLMKAAKADQSRMLQQTICHHGQNNWTFSISWGYSVHIYEKVLSRSFLQNPIETFKKWSDVPREPPHYMFNTRLPSNDSCEAPHVFFFKNVKKITSKEILTIYSRVAPRGTPACLTNSADFISEIQVLSPTMKRKEMDRCECCDITGIVGTRAKLKFRECVLNEIIA